MADQIHFDEAHHVYTLNGTVVPSVTTILNPWSCLEHVDPDVLQTAAEFGTNVHAAVHLHNIGMLDRSSINDVMTDYLAGWEKFLDDSGAVVVESEEIVWSSKSGYAGTLDSVAMIGKTLRLIDIKTGSVVPKSVGPQTAAYNQALREMTGRPLMQRMCVQLLPNDYKIKHLKDPSDIDIFRAALTLHRWKTN